MTYWRMRRVALFMTWLPIWFPEFFIAVLRGWFKRAVKKTVDYTSPFLFAYSRKAFVCPRLLLVGSFLCPTLMPPSIVPVLLGFMALCFGNMRKRI